MHFSLAAIDVLFRAMKETREEKPVSLINHLGGLR